MNLDGKRIVITGASSGIGRALLQELAMRPLQVVAVARDKIGLRDAVESVGAPRTRVTSFNGDLTLQGEVDDLFEYAVGQMGGIDIFLANAGIAYWERIRKPDWARIETIFRTNVFSPVYTVEKMHSLFHGADYRVVITSSVLGQVGLEGYALYASTKAALDRFAEVYRLQTERRGQLVLVYPLAVRSSFFQRAGQAPVPLLSQSAEEAARAIIRGIEKDRETIYTSWILPPMLLLNHLFPFTRRWYQAIDAKVSRQHWAAQEKQESHSESGRE